MFERLEQGVVLQKDPEYNIEYTIVTFIGTGEMKRF
jgi:hypothetical protein